MYDSMKMNVILSAAGQKVFRSQEERCKRKAKRYTSSNYPTWNMLREEIHQQRLGARRGLRYLNLARGFLRNSSYLTLEQSTREGNEPLPSELRDTLDIYGYPVGKSTIKQWLKGGPDDA